jgi:hypothetical protein
VSTGEPNPAAQVEQLLRERAEREWLGGEAVLALAAVAQVPPGRYRVGRLDRDGREYGSVADVVDATTQVKLPGMFDAVRADHPDGAAVGLYEAAALGLHVVADDPTWLIITPGRIAVLRLLDLQRNGSGGAVDALLGGAKRSRGDGLLRRVGEAVKAGATELVTSVRRPLLADRPQDAVLQCPFVLPIGHLQSIVPWKPPMVPLLRHGPRYVKVQFVDGSYACLETDIPGATALTGSRQ